MIEFLNDRYNKNRVCICVVQHLSKRPHVRTRSFSFQLEAGKKQPRARPSFKKQNKADVNNQKVRDGLFLASSSLQLLHFGTILIILND